GSKKKFSLLPHQFDPSVFNLKQTINFHFRDNKKVVIMYHGALQAGRDLDIFLDAYNELLKENVKYRTGTEVILRIKGQSKDRLKRKYESENIQFLETVV